MAAVLEGMGHVVEEAGRPFTADDWLAFMPLWTGSAAGIPLAEDDLPKVTELTRWLREEGIEAVGRRLQCRSERGADPHPQGRQQLVPIR